MVTRREYFNNFTVEIRRDWMENIVINTIRYLDVDDDDPLDYGPDTDADGTPDDCDDDDDNDGCPDGEDPAPLDPLVTCGDE